MNRYILIDIGGTAVKYGVAMERETLDDSAFVSRGSFPTEAWRGGEDLQKRVLSLIGKLLAENSGGEIRGVAISSAGMVDVRQGKIFHAGYTMPAFTGVEFKRPVEERFGFPCEIENDVNCAGLAEYVSGAGKGAGSLLVLTIGTGIGGCFIEDGRVLHGRTGSACEVGYLAMHGSTFEKLGAASILTKRVAEAKGEPCENWDGIQVFSAARSGDEVCIEAIDKMCAILGEGIADLCYVLNPERVVLGGGIMAQKEYLYPRIRMAMDRCLIPVIAKNTELRMAEQGNSAGMIGAYYHFRSARKKQTGGGEGA